MSMNVSVSAMTPEIRRQLFPKNCAATNTITYLRINGTHDHIDLFF